VHQDIQWRFGVQFLSRAVLIFVVNDIRHFLLQGPQWGIGRASLIAETPGADIAAPIAFNALEGLSPVPEGQAFYAALK
jgi:hypothetical protein